VSLRKSNLRHGDSRPGTAAHTAPVWTRHLEARGRSGHEPEHTETQRCKPSETALAPRSAAPALSVRLRVQSSNAGAESSHDACCMRCTRTRRAVQGACPRVACPRVACPRVASPSTACPRVACRAVPKSGARDCLAWAIVCGAGRAPPPAQERSRLSSGQWRGRLRSPWCATRRSPWPSRRRARGLHIWASPSERRARR